MRLISGDLGATATYSRRPFAWLAFSTDGSDGTLFLSHCYAQKRGRTAVHTSRYSVGEVDSVGFMGRCFVFDKTHGDDERERKPGDRQPPYQVRLDVHGQVSCTCMADACKSPCCRHQDAIIALLDEGAFDREGLHDATSGVSYPNVTISERRYGTQGTTSPHGSERDRQRQATSREAGSATQHRMAMVEGQDRSDDWHGRTYPPEAPQDEVKNTSDFF